MERLMKWNRDAFCQICRVHFSVDHSGHTDVSHNWEAVCTDTLRGKGKKNEWVKMYEF